MKPMTEAEFLRECGTGDSQEAIIDALIAFHRSHGHDEMVRMIEKIEPMPDFLCDDDCEPSDDGDGEPF